MHKLQASRILSRGVLLLLVLWGLASFFLFKSPLPAEILVTTFALIAGYLIFAPKDGPFVAGWRKLFLLYFINFVNFYAFYGLLFTYNLPLYIVMIGIFIVSGSSFFFLGQKVANRNFFYLYLLFFVIITLEVFLAMSFWLINPLTRSLMMVISIYILLGLWTSITNGEFNKESFRKYLVVAVAIILVTILTVGWGH